jgi:phosphoserine aminotransferase
VLPITICDSAEIENNVGQKAHRMNEMPSHIGREPPRSSNQFGLRRLLELPGLFAIFFYLGGAVGPEASFAMAAVLVSFVGYFSSGKASLYSCVLYAVLILATVAGAIRGIQMATLLSG